MPKKKTNTKPEAVVQTVDWDDPSLYFNRELSFLLFNLRVLEEALDERHPLAGTGEVPFDLFPTTSTRCS